MHRARRNELTLHQQQQQLLLRSAELRATLVQQARVLQAPLALADQLRTGLRWLRARPAWAIGALALVALLRRRRASGWAARLWGVWKLVRQVRHWMSSRPTAPDDTPDT